MPTFKIVNGQDFSLRDVRCHQEEGGSVLRSAHIGNFDVTTLFLAQERFPIILHEHVNGAMKGYEPGAVLLDGEKLPIADSNEVLVTHGTLSRNLSVRARVQAITGDFSNPAQAHYLALRKLFPGNVQLASELLLGQDPLFLSALSELSIEYPYLFDRYVTRAGEMLRLSGMPSTRGQFYASPGGAKITVHPSAIARLTYQYLRDTIDVAHGSPVRPQGTVMSTNLYILLTTVCELGRSHRERRGPPPGEVTVLHFSGFAMMKYMVLSAALAERNQRTINAAYEYLAGRLHGQLPERINFIVIPTGSLRNYIRRDPGSAEVPGNLSQYDVLKYKTRLRVAEWVYSASQRELTAKHTLARKVSRLPWLSRDISYCVSANVTDEEVCAEVRRVFEGDSVLLWKAEVLARTPFGDLPVAARQRLGAGENQDNVLVRITLKGSGNTLTRAQASEVCVKLYSRLHQGSRKGYGIQV